MLRAIKTKKLIKNALRALFRPHRAFKEISGNTRLNYKIVIPLVFIWGIIFDLLNAIIFQRTVFVSYGGDFVTTLITIFIYGVYGLSLLEVVSIIFYLISRLFKKKIKFEKIEIGVFYLWFIWALSPIFNIPHFFIDAPLWRINAVGVSFSWFFIFPSLIILSFFLFKDLLKFKKKQIIFAGFFSLALPFLGRFIGEELSQYLSNFLNRFNSSAPSDTQCCLLFAFISLVIIIFFRKNIFKKPPVKKNIKILYAPIFSVIVIIFLWTMTFAPWLITPEKIENFGMGKSRWTHSYTWNSGDKLSGTVRHPATGNKNDDSSRYWSDTYASGAFDFIPSRVSVQELRVEVHFTSATANKRSGAGPKAQGCWQVGTTSTYYCSNWIENLNGASTQTFTISSSSIRTYDATGDGAAAGSTEWNNLVSNLQSGGENIIVHTWTEGDGNSGSQNGDVVEFDEVYAEVYYTGGDFTQHTYRWYVNTDAVQPTDPWPSGVTDIAENTAITTSDSPPTDGDVLRLRMNVKGAMDSGTEAFKLQYGQGSTCSSISSWTDVDGLSGSGIWRGYNNATPADGATVTSNLLSNSTVSGTYEEANNSANNPNTATMSDYTEYDWVIQDNGAPENTTYCFRMVEDGGTVFDTYTNYPKLTTKPAYLTQRAYIFENDDGADVNSNSDIASANTALTDILRGERFVTRLQIDETNNVSTGDKTYKLQYDKNSNGQWTDVKMAGAPSSNSGGNFGEWEINTISGASEPASTGKWTSVAVPSDGKPVISFYNATDGDLAVCKCNDSDCISTPTCNYNVDSTNDVGKYSAIAINPVNGYPVIAHIDDTNNRVRVCACSNSSCSSASCNTLNNIPANYSGDEDNSLDIAVDTSGYPWISFDNNSSDHDLEVCHCNDSTCAGQNETCTAVDTDGNAGNFSSIPLDSSGNPIVAYYDYTNTDLNVAKYVGSGGTGCASSAWTCTSSIDDGGRGASVALLSNGIPVIAHHTDTLTGWGASLEFCKCGNSSCSSGNTCGQIKDLGDHGGFTSLAIGKDDLPIIVDYNHSNADLYFYKCNDNACSGGDEFYQKLDSTNSVGKTSSMAVGVDGWPVISYLDETNTNLKVAKMMPLAEIRASWGLSGANGDNLTSAAAGTCYGSKTFQDGEWHEATGTSVSYSLDANKCTEFGFMIDTSEATVGETYRLRLVESDGTTLSSYSQYPTFTIVSEANNTKRYSKQSVLRSASSCAGGSTSYSCTNLTSGTSDSYTSTNDYSGAGTSIAIGTDGNPIIAMANMTNSDLEVCKCRDKECLLSPVCSTVDTTDGDFPSIVIGTDGKPVISFSDSVTGDLRVCKCSNDDCSSASCSAVDTSGTALWDSIAIGTDGYPVIAFYDGATNYNLRVCKCNDAACSSAATCTNLDTTDDVGRYTSIAIGTDGYPIISYYKYTGGNELKAYHCTNNACSAGNAYTVESGANYGSYSSIAIGSDGKPVISHYDISSLDARVCRCVATDCNNTDGYVCNQLDTSGNVGQWTSIGIGTDGYPFVSLYDADGQNLRICDCADASCSSQSCTAVDVTDNVGKFTSLAIGVDGYPVVSYIDHTNGDVNVAKGIGLPTTATAYFANGSVTDRQIKFKSDNTNSQFLQHWPSVEDGLLYWLDNKGYDNVSGHDGNRDQITSSANESPVYDFIDKHSSDTNNIYVQWTGRSDVAASTKNIKLEIYNFNTDSWETVTTESSCSADTDCVISGSKTSNLSYYYFPRYTYDSTKAEKDTTVEYYTYWRVYQETAAGSQTLKTDNWSIGSVAFISVSGNAYENETSTALTACDGSTGMISLRFGSETYGPISCADSDGAFTLSGIPISSAGDPMVLWIDGQTDKASTVNRYSGSGNTTGIELRKDRLMIMSESGNVTNSNLDVWDSGNDSDIIYSVSSNNLTLADGYKLIVKSGVTYQPGGQVTTSPSSNSSTTDGDILIQSTGVLNMESYGISCGGDFTNSGTLTLSSGQTTTFSATSTGHTIAHGTATFENVIFNGSGGGWSFNSSATLNGDLTMTAGTLSGTNNISVYGGDVTGNGTINLTGGTFMVDGQVTNGFGGNTSWTFYNLTFGDGSGSTSTIASGSGEIIITNILTIAANQELNAASKTWTLSGTGTPFVINGTFTPYNSTFSYTGDGSTNVKNTTYYDLSIGTSNSANITYTAQGEITVANNLSLQSASVGYTNTFDMSSYNLFVGSDVFADSGNISVPARSALTQSSDGTTTLGSSAGATPAIGGVGSTTFGVLNLGITSDNTSYTINLGGNISVLETLTITSGGTGTHGFDVTTSNYQITVGGSWTNNGDFICRQGTVIFNATTTGKTISDGGDPFYDIVFNGSGGEWLYQDGASTAPNSTTVQAGEATFLNTKKGTVSVTGGQLNSDWYVGVHLVDATNTATNIDTNLDSDIQILENSGTPQSTVWRYNSGWGSAATSQTTGTDATGINPQPTTTGAIRIREYAMTNSSTCPGAGCTLYKYNLKVNWQPSYGEYDYYDGYGENYLTSCWAGTSTACLDDSSDDDAIGENWYRATPGSVNGSKPYDGLNEPPDQYGTWYIGMIQGLDVTISDYTIEFGTIEPGADPANQTNNITVETGAPDGYIAYIWSNQQMTSGSNTIADWTGTNESPTVWSSGEGFGYSTDDYTLTGGTQDRFSGSKYAGFNHSGPGFPVADRTEPTLSADGQNTITYRLGTSQTTAAGTYSSIVIFDVVPQY